MAIKQIVTGGIGLNDGEIGWAITGGFGSLDDGLDLWLLSPFGLRNRKSLPVIVKK